jgi:hypothetical protein
MGSKTEMKNALITGTQLGYEDHGIFTFFVFLDFGGIGGGFGGYALDGYDKETKCRKHSSFTGNAIEAILKVAGVDSWEKLKGKYVRAETEGLGGKTLEIVHILDDEIRFSPEIMFQGKGE